MMVLNHEVIDIVFLMEKNQWQSEFKGILHITSLEFVITIGPTFLTLLTNVLNQKDSQSHLGNLFKKKQKKS